MVLDTSVCVDLIRESSQGKEGPARNCLKTLGRRQLFISYFSICELYTGIHLNGQKAQEQENISLLLDGLTVIYPDHSFPNLYGEAAAALLKAGTPIPVMDLLIGISAKSESLPLLTRDVSHFSRIPGLIVETYM